jgi:hypothetical protein
MHKEVDYIGPNKTSFYFGQWSVKKHRICLYRAPLGGMYVYVIDEIDQVILTWPSYPQKAIILCQLNYLADQILQGNIKFVDSIACKHMFHSKYDILQGEEPNVKLHGEALNEWQQKIFGSKLDMWEDKYIYIDHLPLEELIKTFNELTELWVKDISKNWKSDKRAKGSTKRLEEPEEEMTDEELQKILNDTDLLEDDF